VLDILGRLLQTKWKPIREKKGARGAHRYNFPNTSHPKKGQVEYHAQQRPYSLQTGRAVAATAIAFFYLGEEGV